MISSTDGPKPIPDVSDSASEYVPRLYIFQCSSETYLGCIEKGLFGSNEAWPLQIRKGDFCLLHHYDAGALFGLWRTESNGGLNLVKKAWNGKYPYQAKVTLVSAKIIEVPKILTAEFCVDPSVGKYESVVEAHLAKSIIETLQGARAQ